MKPRILALLAAATLLLGAPSPVHADDSSPHPDVAYAMAAVPGGVMLDEDTVIWPALGMTLSAESPESAVSRTVGSCGTGLFCAYSGTDQSGTKLSFSACTTVSTAALSSVRSVANARSSGNVQARNSSGTVLATAAAGSAVNVGGTTVSLRCTL
ncbi:peptidase inhibitor family I36 protein [Microbacterium sp. ZW T5_45]|uniref:peptidase inhibitor family I36 protein n=1 Tax=Microbacterium sp. ZW T5_45 TaxID=3378080 RepID=UPI003854A156